MNSRLAKKLKILPTNPGVYFHKSSSGEVIYVGKAAVLRNRVRQYFRESKDFDAKTQALVAEIDDTDWIETESEVDALFLESEMVKRYMPRYNILLRDDKSQTFVRIDMKSDWPTIGFTRNPLDDGATYIGPFYNGRAVKIALRYLRKVFPYYMRSPERRQSRLSEQIGLEPSRDTTSHEYKLSLRKLIRYIEGGRVPITRELEREMKAAARREDFEQATILRNRLRALSELQRRIMFGDREFLNISKDQALVQITELLGLKQIPVRIEGYDISHISGSGVVASMVVFTNGVSDRGEYRKFKLSRQVNDDTGNIYEVISRRLSDRNLKSWGAPDIMLIDGGVPQVSSATQAAHEASVTPPIIGIAKRQDEIVMPKDQEFFDYSFVRNLQQRPIAGVFVDELPDYYIVNIHANRLNASGHSRNLRGGDEVSPYDDLMKMLQRIRDESHRFAVSYHTKLQAKVSHASVLDDIPGIGPATRKKLLRKFGSVRGVQGASVEQLTETIGAAKARIVYQNIAKV